MELKTRLFPAPNAPGIGAVLALLLTGAAADATGQPVVTPIRVEEPPVIDGLLDDETWRGAARLSTFVQTTPVEGAAASEPTEVYIAYDGENLYVGVRARYADTGLMRANRADRDQIAEDDTVSLFFDPFRDRQRAYQFTVNGFGVQGDAILNSTGLRNRTQRRAIGARGGGPSGAPPSGIPEGDISWDALFVSAGTPSDDGWTAEMAIPFKSLRYPAVDEGESHRWGFQVSRTVKGKDETVVWSPLSRNIAQFLAQMGVLEGLADLSTSRNLEILPTVTALRTGSLNALGAFIENDVEEAGLNLKYGISSDLTADFTINPDFSQIESDLPQIDVNQRFPLFYPELRPFFLEGQEIFNVFAPITPIHTRTIIDPRYGGKVSGKVGRNSLGLLFADDEAPGKRDPSDPAFGQTANVAIGRARFDLYPESFVGATFTNRDFMDSYSRMLAFDSNMRLGATNRWNVFLSRSWHRDERGVERRGEMMGTFFNHVGRNVNFSAFHGGTTPDFRIDTGFVRRVDDKRLSTNLSYRWWPEHWLVNWGPRVRYGRNYSFENVLMDENVGGGLDFTFARNVRLGLSADRALERYGGLDFWKWNHGVDFDVNASRRIALVGSFSWGESIRYIGMPFLGRGRLGRLTAIFRPVSRLQSQLNVELSRLEDPRTATLVFDIQVLRALTTFQFTERLLLRNIMVYNSFDGTLDGNLLLTYRVNSGTVFYLGYDGHYQQEDRLDPLRYFTERYRQTNRAIFTKISYLFRY